MFSTAEDLAKLMRAYLRGGLCDGGARLFGEAEMREIAPSRASRGDGARTFGWISAAPDLPESLFGTSLFHSGFSGQTVLFDRARQRYAIVLTTRCGDYERAKRERFDVIAALMLTPEECASGRMDGSSLRELGESLRGARGRETPPAP